MKINYVIGIVCAISGGLNLGAGFATGDGAALLIGALNALLSITNFYIGGKVNEQNVRTDRK